EAPSCPGRALNLLPLLQAPYNLAAHVRAHVRKGEDRRPLALAYARVFPFERCRSILYTRCMRKTSMYKLYEQNAMHDYTIRLTLMVSSITIALPFTKGTIACTANSFLLTT